MTPGTTIRSGLIRKVLSFIRSTSAEFALPMLQRPRHLQTAALCYRVEDGRKRVLLITSRGTGRWVIPKGWLMRGKKANEAAVVEAWEEAGVRPGRTADQPIGTYVYDKIKNSGLPVTVEMLVFPVEVQSLEDQFPEARERTRRWVTPAEAAEMVDEPGLKQILLGFGDN